jgi:outer membrane protein assembly factor BamB
MSAADGKITYRERYLSTQLQNNMYNTVAIYEDAVFGFGGGAKAGSLQCTNLEDGRLLWEHKHRDWTKDQNLVVADGLIFAITSGGELVLAEASRNGYQELGRVKVPADLEKPQQPTIANGRLYIRGTNAVVCYQVGQE